MKMMRRLKCRIAGHQYFTRQTLTAHSRRVGCKYCGGDWAMNDDVRVIVPWSAEFDKFYAEQGHIIKETA